MTKVNSSGAGRDRKGQKSHHPTPAHAHKPKKPHKDFPLYAHSCGQWAKKIRQKLHYFGPWADPQGALNRWLQEKDYLLAGKVPRSRTDAVDEPNLRDLCRQFLVFKAARRDAGLLSPHTWKAYYVVCDELGATFGGDRLLIDILPEDFEVLHARWAKKWGVERLAAEIGRVRTVFKYAKKKGLVKRDIEFGDGFSRPTKKTMRLNKAAAGPKMFEADELRRLIDRAGKRAEGKGGGRRLVDAPGRPMKAMLLLAINAGMGNEDVGQMPITALDLERGWLNYPRPKTGIERRCPLWPETVSAIREWLSHRPTPRRKQMPGCCS